MVFPEVKQRDPFQKLKVMSKGKLKEKFKDKLKSYLVRCNAETPPFFKKLRTVGVIIVAAGTAVVTAPVALPAMVLAIGGYLIVGGAVASAVSQAAIADAQIDCPEEEQLD